MLFSLGNVPDEDIPSNIQPFLKGAEALETKGMVLTHEALTYFLSSTSIGKDAWSLIKAVSDEDSKKRVDIEMKRLFVTGRVTGDLAEKLREIVEVLGLEENDLSVKNNPLVLALYADAGIDKPAVIINITGVKHLADALRTLWSRMFMSPYPEEDTKSAIVIMRMPPVHITARVRVHGDSAHVEAVHGWGKFVQTDEVFDEYTVAGTQVVSKTVGNQQQMISRNPRTGEVVQTKPAGGDAQKLTDIQVLNVVRDARKFAPASAVFGVSGEQRWLLFAEPLGYLGESVESEIEKDAAEASLEKAGVAETGAISVAAAGTEDLPSFSEEEVALAKEEGLPVPEEEVDSEDDEDLEAEDDEPEDEAEDDEQEEDEPEDEDDELVEDDDEDEDIEEDDEVEDDETEDDEEDDLVEEDDDEDEDIEEDDEVEDDETEEDEPEDEDDEPEDEDEDDEFVEEDDEPEDDDEEDEDDETEDDEPEDEDEDDELVQEDTEDEDEDDEGETEDDEDDEPDDEDDELVEEDDDDDEDDVEEEGDEEDLEEEDEAGEPDTEDVPASPPRPDKHDAVGSHDEVKKLSQEVVYQSLSTIEAALRNWLHEKGPEDILDLVNEVAKKRTVPYKQRIITLCEMREQDIFKQPDPDTVRFALDTVHRFINEF